jgi:very-short-patch-repair endonuclease
MTIEDTIREFALEVAVRARRHFGDDNVRLFVDGFADQFSANRDRCESPIEELMLGALLLEGSHGEDDECRDCRVMPPDYPRGSFLQKCNEEHATPSSCMVMPQFQISDHRVDFCIAFYRGLHVVVECDGHEWHERTPEQPRRDKARDRAIQAEGFQVFRFTGSEIWRDPAACARELFNAASEMKIRQIRAEYEHEREYDRLLAGDPSLVATLGAIRDAQ